MCVCVCVCACVCGAQRSTCLAHIHNRVEVVLDSGQESQVLVFGDDEVELGGTTNNRDREAWPSSKGKNEPPVFIAKIILITKWVWP